MALTLVIEDGTGISNANAYLTVSEATDILCVNSVMLATWSSFSVAKQESLLIWASIYIDTYVNWYGNKAIQGSGLKWPRECIVDEDGFAVPTNQIPVQLKRAVAQLAIFLNVSAAAASGGESSNIPEGIKSVRADVVEVEFFENGSADARTGVDLLPVNMKYLIKGLGTVSTGRTRFARIIK